MSPSFLYGTIDSNDSQHSKGKSSSNFIVHGVDSSKLTGHNYEITFSDFENKSLSFSVNDLNTNEYQSLKYLH